MYPKKISFPCHVCVHGDVCVVGIPTSFLEPVVCDQQVKISPKKKRNQKLGSDRNTIIILLAGCYQVCHTNTLSEPLICADKS